MVPRGAFKTYIFIGDIDITIGDALQLADPCGVRVISIVALSAFILVERDLLAVLYGHGLADIGVVGVVFFRALDALRVERVVSNAIVDESHGHALFCDQHGQLRALDAGIGIWGVFDTVHHVIHGAIARALEKRSRSAAETVHRISSILDAVEDMILKIAYPAGIGKVINSAD